MVPERKGMAMEEVLPDDLADWALDVLNGECPGSRSAAVHALAEAVLQQRDVRVEASPAAAWLASLGLLQGDIDEIFQSAGL